MNDFKMMNGPMGRNRYPFARQRQDGVRDRADNVTPARCEMITGDNGAELMIYGVIDSEVWWGDEVTASQVVEALASIDGADVTVRINSPGGLVTEGMAMFNALVAHRGRVTTQVDGIAASIASVVMMAGKERQALGQGATVMIHNAWGFAIGDHRDMEGTAQLLAQMDGQIAGIYASHGTIDKDAALAAMADETWYTAETALAAGFLTSVLNAPEDDVQNCIRTFDLQGFANVPKALIQNERRSLEPAPAPEPAPEPVIETPVAFGTDDMARRLRFATTE